MSNVLNYETFTAINEKNYTIIWDHFEGEIDKINEEIVVIPTFHAKDDRMNPEKISMRHIKDIVDQVAPVLISNYNKNPRVKENNTVFILRDRRSNSEIDKNPYRYERKYQIDEDPNSSMAIVGAFYNQDQVRTNRNDPGFVVLLNDEPLEVKIWVDTLRKDIDLKPNDYLFKVITCRRKKNFVNTQVTDIILDVYDDHVDVIRDKNNIQ